MCSFVESQSEDMFRWTHNSWLILWAVILGICLSAPGFAVIFYSTDDPNHNTTAPTGDLASSGWQWVGYWGAFQGVAIGPHHFIAARHIGGAVGDPFVFDGISYTTTASYDDATTDLRIWQVSGTFPTWAPLYRTTTNQSGQPDEVGRTLIVFGRGLGRGAEILVGSTGRGWQWGSADGRLRWGENVVVSVVNGGSYWGALLYATFDEIGLAEEAHLASGDSSGPVFINDGSGWKLAGVAALVDALFNTTNSGDGFNAAIFDARGLYFGSNGNWQRISGSKPVPSGFYATRVSVRADWIDSIVPPETVPEATDAPLFPPGGLPGLALALLGAGVWFLRVHPDGVNKVTSFD
jgi:hypothetical protein